MPHPLAFAEAIYSHTLTRRRQKFAVTPVRLECPVVSVGNLTTGGTGKTPAVQWLARHLQEKGRRVAVVARGYRGELSSAGAVVSDGEQILLDARQAGDEPVLHARALPGAMVVIGRDRVAAAREAVRLGAQVIVLDDGFQFWSLHRDFDLVLLDARRPFDNGHLLPRGRLREPPAALSRADGVLLTRADRATAEELAAARRACAAQSDAPIWEATHAPVAVRDEASSARRDLAELAGCPVGALSALADNGAFAASLLNCGALVTATAARRDHHFWTEQEVRRFAQRARAAGGRALVTTEKDAVKIRAAWAAPLPLWSLQIALQVAEETGLYERIRETLES